MKKTFKLDKLVRDDDYQAMLEKGMLVKRKELSAAEVIEYFKAKMLEEAAEICAANSTEDLLSEMADCLEVLRGFADALETDFSTIEELRQNKLAARGGFTKRIVLETVSMEPDCETAQYFMTDPAKYPEV